MRRLKILKQVSNHSTSEKNGGTLIGPHRLKANVTIFSLRFLTALFPERLAPIHGFFRRAEFMLKIEKLSRFCTQFARSGL
ncbi:hypothetical protein KFK09_004337 [Dendrobium nobile]|uniref:Uncharacterized protein n=1 Tax=Dendrobium nobile TaxID=94219 RepID=A0A8T3C5G8_DENNO|nr:hypothetical protein KFK09_004337 [Dendrobium nobile]